MLHFVEPERRLTQHWPLLLRAACKRAGQHQDFWLTIPWQDSTTATLERYQRLFNFATAQRPLTSYFLPIQRAQLYCMLKSSFGFSPVGLIHLQNKMSWQQHALMNFANTEPLQLSTNVQLLPQAPNEPLICRFSSYLHPKLTVFPSCPAELPAVLLSCHSDYLIKRGNAASGQVKQAEPAADSAVDSWHVSANAGRQYARVSGDFNPIHLTNITARLLGMRQAIIHGMHTVARVEASLSDRRAPLNALNAQFKRALPLGNTARLFLLEPGAGSVWQDNTLVLQFDYC